MYLRCLTALFFGVLLLPLSGCDDAGGETPLGGGCSVDGDCASGICIADGKAAYCSNECRNDTECESGFSCQANYCVEDSRPTRDGSVGAGGMGAGGMGAGGEGGMGAGGMGAGGEGGMGAGGMGAGGMGAGGMGAGGMGAGGEGGMGAGGMGAGGEGGMGAGGEGGMGAGGTGAGGMGGGPGPDVSNCADLFECITACDNDPNCFARCGEAAPQAAASLFGLFSQCASENQCARLDDDCAARNCADELTACLETPVLVVEDCNAIFGCLATCEDEACFNACVDAAPPEEAALFRVFGACAEANQCESIECAQEACPDELAACVGEMPNPNPEGGTCSDFFTCLNDCQDAACQQRCMDATNAEGQDQINAIFGCGEANNCQDNDCLRANCDPEIVACFGEPPMGEDDCNTIYECVWACQNEECPQECYAAGTAEAQALYLPYNQCSFDAQCADQMSCDAACPAELAACTGHVPPDPDPELGTCSDFLICVGECQDVDCQQECMNATSPEGQDQANAISACALANGCQDDACVTENCGPEMAICSGDVPPDPDPEGGTCDDFFTCLQPCEDVACQQACMDATNADGQAQANAIFACGEENQCQDNACFNENCNPELLACFGESPMGEDDCNSIYECVWMCQDQDCLQACFNAGTAEAQALYLPYNQCAVDANCNDQMSCDAACPAELAACVEGIPNPDPDPVPEPGMGTCNDFFTCLGDCQDAACQQRCMDATTEEGQGQANAIFACGEENNCEDSACVSENCNPEITACFGEPPMGEENCNSIYECIWACQDRDCPQACFDAGTAGAQALYLSYNECIVGADCNDQMSCDAACPAELDACQAEQ